MADYKKMYLTALDAPPPVYIHCHSEPVRRLAWESVPRARRRSPLPGGCFQRGRAAALPLWSFQGEGIFKGRGKSKSLSP